jgi:hypothetical protein
MQILTNEELVECLNEIPLRGFNKHSWTMILSEFEDECIKSLFDSKGWNEGIDSELIDCLVKLTEIAIANVER